MKISPKFLWHRAIFCLVNPRVSVRLLLGQEVELEDIICLLAKDGTLAKAGKQAIEDAHRHGLPVTVKEGNAIIQLYPDGRKEIIADNLPSWQKIKKRRIRIPPSNINGENTGQ